MSGSLFMPLWTDAYLGDTKHLTTLQHGAYLLLLMAMWRKGGQLPFEEKRLAREVGMSLDKWRKASPEVLELFDIEGDVITQKRLKLELEKSLGLAQKRALAGSAGGRAKSLKTKKSPVAHATADEEQKATLQLPITNTNSNPLASQDPPDDQGDEIEAGAKPVRKARSKTADTARATRIPADWRAGDEHYDIAMGLGLSERQTTNEADRFFDYWSAKGGKEARKVDWLATWRNWCRTAADRFGPQAKPALQAAKRPPAI